jgi:hypothetical protein
MPTRDAALAWQALWCPKRGHTPEEYEDAFAADEPAGRFAVADGASESSFAGLWARLLARHGARAAGGAFEHEDWLREPRLLWSADVDARPLPWYAEAKREQGAYATLLVLTVRPPAGGKPGRWHALAVGDSCLFRLREGSLRAAFPVEESVAFDRNPELIGARPDAPAVVPQQAHGESRVGDHYLMMTDALAQWFLRESESGNKPWAEVARVLDGPEPDAAFTAWVEGLRDLGGLHNDDVTLVSIRV